MGAEREKLMGEQREVENKVGNEGIQVKRGTLTWGERCEGGNQREREM